MKGTPRATSLCTSYLSSAILLVVAVMVSATLSFAQQSRPKIAIAINEAQKETFQRLVPGKPSTVENSETDVFVTNASDSWVLVRIFGSGFLYEGVIAPSKGLGQLINGWPQSDVAFVLPSAQYTVAAIAGPRGQDDWVEKDFQVTQSQNIRVSLMPVSTAPSPTGMSADQQPDDAVSINSAIDKIAQNPHQDLPQPTQSAVAQGQSPGWSIQNATVYRLHLYLSGPVQRDYVIPQGNSITIDLPAGSYRVAAEVSDKRIIPFYAVRQLNINTRWKSHFYIAPQ
jgi:hypothetical protein